MPLLRRIPLPILALALGTACLGNLLASYSETIRTACTLAAAAIVLLALLRAALDFRSVRAELDNPATLAVLPALFMTLMLLATYLRPTAPQAALALWLIALAVQLVTVGVFLVRFVIPFKLARVLPTWLLVFVGFVVASVTSPAYAMQPLGRALLVAGLLGYVLTLPVVVWRLIKGGPLPAPALPTLTIVAAPPSLCLVGYLAVVAAPRTGVVYALLAAAAVSLVFVATRLPQIVGLGFTPALGALTFPLAISGVAIKQSAKFLSAAPDGLAIPSAAVQTMELLAAAAVLYVLVRYTLHLATPAKSHKIAEPAFQPGG